MLQFIRLHDPAPRLLLTVEPLFPRHALCPFHAALREREHLVDAALRPFGGVLLDVSTPDHAIHGAAGSVRVSIEMSFGKIAVGDTAIHPHVGQRPIRAILETLALRARIIFAPVAAALVLLSLFGVIPGALDGQRPDITG